MTSLTEQYLNGNLHDGDEYYIENKDGEIFTMCLYNDTIHWHSFKVKKLSVLAPVPSYEEWQASYNCMAENEVLRLKNAKLKELLKRAKVVLEDEGDYMIVQEINQALGEDK